MAARFAIVTDDSPLEVQIHGDLTSSPVTSIDSTVPALAVDDEVLVDIISGRLIVTAKVVDA